MSSPITTLITARLCHDVPTVEVVAHGFSATTLRWACRNPGGAVTRTRDWDTPVPFSRAQEDAVLLPLRATATNSRSNSAAQRGQPAKRALTIATARPALPPSRGETHRPRGFSHRLPDAKSLVSLGTRKKAPVFAISLWRNISIAQFSGRLDWNVGPPGRLSHGRRS